MEKCRILFAPSLNTFFTGTTSTCALSKKHLYVVIHLMLHFVIDAKLFSGVLLPVSRYMIKMRHGGHEF